MKQLTDEQIKRASLDAGMQEHYMDFHSGFIRFAHAIIAKFCDVNGLTNECPHWVDDGACKECYSDQVKGQEAVAWLITTEKQDGSKETHAMTGRYKDIQDCCDFGEPIPLYTTPPAQPACELVGLLEGAHQWIELASHGDNCYVSDNYEGDPGARCNCGKESIVSAIEHVLLSSDAQPAREWVGLTETELVELAGGEITRDERMICRAIESKLREKNAGQPAKHE